MIIESSRNHTLVELMAVKPSQTQVIQKSEPRLPSVSDILRPNQYMQSRQEYRNYALTLQLAYYLEQNTSIFADIVITLQQEIFRRGMSWKPKFVCKCAECGTEYQERKYICDCGCTALIEPDRSQLRKFKREDGTSFLEKANLNDQSLRTVLWTYHRHVEISDNPYLLCVKNYIFDSVDINQLLSATPVEILPLDPREVRLRIKSNGMPQDDVWICVLHREKAGTKGQVCQICGRKLFPAYAETYGAAGSTKYYIKGEIFTKPLYYPGIAGGFPPILKILYDAWAYHHLERWTYDYYREGHGRGILAFPTNNQESLRAMWEELTLKWQEEPSFTPAVAFDPGSGKGTATFIKLLEDPNPEMLEVKKDLRERLGSFFGVSLVFQNDTSNSGGLKNDLNLMRVTAHAVEGKQTYYNGDIETNYNDGVLAWICRQFGITDFVLQLNPSEDEDEVAKKEQFKLDIENARGMWELGFDVHYDDDKFTFSGQAKPKPEPQQFGSPPFGGAIEQATGAPDNVHKGRVYIKNPNDAPKGAKVERGPKGGLYYEDGEKQPQQNQKPDDKKPSSVKITEAPEEYVKLFSPYAVKVQTPIPAEEFRTLLQNVITNTSKEMGDVDVFLIPYGSRGSAWTDPNIKNIIFIPQYPDERKKALEAAQLFKSLGIIEGKYPQLKANDKYQEWKEKTKSLTFKDELQRTAMHEKGHLETYDELERTNGAESRNYVKNPAPLLDLMKEYTKHPSISGILTQYTDDSSKAVAIGEIMAEDYRLMKGRDIPQALFPNMHTTITDILNPNNIRERQIILKRLLRW